MNKTNQLLVGLLALQGLVFVGMKVGGGSAEDNRPKVVLEGFEPGKVSKLEIIGEPKDAADPKAPPQTSVTLTKTGTQWGIAAADGYPADNQKVEEFLGKLAKLKTRGPVLTSATYHKKVEVADDKFQRKLKLTVDGKELELILGTSPSLKNVHLRKAGSDEVLQVSELTAWEAGARAWDWVDRAWVKFGENDVWGIAIQNANGVLNLQKDQSGLWNAVGATGAVKKGVLDDLVRKASAMNLEEPVGKTEKPEFGLDQPLAVVTLTTGTSTIAGKLPAELKTEVVRIGKKSDTENRYWAKSTTSPYVVELAGWAVEPLVTKSMKDLLEDTKPEQAAAPKK
ncbi:DUF4340 domain-containing protein [Myxococcota bacterium]|nr:DUF4340 domain-containing protein [Myxococcota bacterium]